MTTKFCKNPSCQRPLKGDCDHPNCTAAQQNGYCHAACERADAEIRQWEMQCHEKTMGEL